jgi:hypothetical protein
MAAGNAGRRRVGEAWIELKSGGDGRGRRCDKSIKTLILKYFQQSLKKSQKNLRKAVDREWTGDIL